MMSFDMLNCRWFSEPTPLNSSGLATRSGLLATFSTLVTLA